MAMLSWQMNNTYRIVARLSTGHNCGAFRMDSILLFGVLPFAFYGQLLDG